MIWGGLGMNAKEYAEQSKAFETLLAFISATDRDRIRGGNAMRLFIKL